MLGLHAEKVLLVVEPDPEFIKKHKKHLRIPGFDCHFVETAQDGIDLLQALPIGFILLNLKAIKRMEEMSAFLDFIRKHRVPYLLIEGSRRVEALATHLRRLGAHPFIALPFKIDDLATRIQSLLSSDPMIGLQVGPEGHRIELTRKLGQGAMGVVYEGCQGSLERKIAVKFLGEDLKGDKDAMDRFFREARAIAQMNSPHIVQVFFVGSHEGQPYLVMELLGGPTLEQYLRTKGVLKPKVALKLAREILLGLIEAHNSNRVHRDLKPANVMLNKRGQAVILDFGLVREGQTNLTQPGVVMGTPRYISPEQVHGGGVDSRCDLYSLGIMLFEMLLGQVPFQGEDFISILWKHVKEPLPSPQSLGRYVEPGLWAIVNKLAAKAADDRYATAEEALAALDSYEQTLQGQNLAPVHDDVTQALPNTLIPKGGLVINQLGEAVQHFGQIGQDHVRLLQLASGLIEQIQGMDGLGSFQRGHLHLENAKLLMFPRAQGLAGVESSAHDGTSRFNAMSTEELQRLFPLGSGA